MDQLDSHGLRNNWRPCQNHGGGSVTSCTQVFSFSLPWCVQNARNSNLTKALGVSPLQIAAPPQKRSLPKHQPHTKSVWISSCHNTRSNWLKLDWPFMIVGTPWTHTFPPNDCCKQVLCAEVVRVILVYWRFWTQKRISCCHHAASGMWFLALWRLMQTHLVAMLKLTLSPDQGWLRPVQLTNYTVLLSFWDVAACGTLLDAWFWNS